VADACGCGAEPTSDPGYRRVLWIVLTINGGMFFAEALGGWIAGSASLQGDALDFLGDAGNYGVALFVLARSLRWRASAALFKGATMTLFGLGVLGYTIWRIVLAQPPTAEIMGVLGFVALAANVISAALLFRHRSGDANRRSVWICSRNDALGNLAVIGAAGLVAWLGHGWPDWTVGFVIAALSVSGGLSIIRQARGELREAA